MSTEQRFVKNTNAPEEGDPLYGLAEGWKISNQSGKIYCSLDDVFYDKENPQSEDNKFYLSLVGQLNGKVKEVIQYDKYYFSAGVTKEKKKLVYAFLSKDEAEKQLRWAFQPDLVVPKAQPQQKLVSTDVSTPASTVQQKVQTVQRTIEVVTDVTPVKVGDISAIGEAEQRGLYVLPIIHVGNQRFCFEDKNGDYILLYGRIIKVEVGDN